MTKKQKNFRPEKKLVSRDELLISAIREKAVLKFIYNDRVRVVEPQTYGVSAAGKAILRAHQISGARMAKLFEVARMENLETTDKKFRCALPAHNPNDSAMVKIFATLPVNADAK